jgi:flagellin-like hook-associated protein FlgL
MSSIVLSAAVRQNLLALQNTAAMMATTQNDLSTGKKVNSALDNPTNFFTASGLDNRASDLSNLLDGISNGVQVLQAANTGITSLQSLVQSAQSVANQVLQSPSPYTSKAGQTSAAITTSAGLPVTSSDLRGTGTVANNQTLSNALNFSTAATAATSLKTLGIAATDTFTLTNSGGTSYTVNFASTNGTQVTGNTISLDLSQATIGGTGVANSLIGALNNLTGTSTTFGISAGKLTANNTGAAAANDLVITNTNGTALANLGLTGTNGVTHGTAVVFTTAAVAPPTLAAAALGTGTQLTQLVTGGGATFTAGENLVVDGQTIHLVNGGGTSTSAAGGNIDLNTATLQDLFDAIDKATGNWTSATNLAGSNTNVNKTTLNGAGKIVVNTGVSNDLSITGTAALAVAGFTAPVSVARTGLNAVFTGVGSAANQTVAVTFGDGTGGTVKSLNDLNNQIASLNLVATLDSTGKLTVQANNDNASQSFTAISGTATNAAAGATAAGAFYQSSPQSTFTPTIDATAQATRANLVSQYNGILTQINATAADSSYNGVNLLNGDQLDLTFNETGKSKLAIAGVTYNASGLGLSQVTATDFQDNAHTNAVISSLETATVSLRSQASAFGSNLSVVQNRQDFNKNLINVLQTGSANLTQADINEEAANSQALSTRQSLSISALSLANSAQQSVLQLLR